MKYEIGFEGAFPLVRTYVEPGEVVKFEKGSMVYNNAKVDIKAKTNGGLLKGITKSMFVDEDMFVGVAVGKQPNAYLAIAPKGMGDIKAIEVGQTQWYLSDGAFLASDGSVDFKPSVQKNLGGIFFGKTGGLLIIKTQGTGTMLVSALGAIEEIELNNEEFNIDNGNVLAWEESLKFNTQLTGGLGGSILSGQGLVTHFSGTGKILVQTRKSEGLASLVVPFLEKEDAMPKNDGPLGGGGPLGGNKNQGPLGGNKGNGPLGGGGRLGGGRNRGGFGR